MSGDEYDNRVVEQRVKRRQDVLENHLHKQHYQDWAATQKEKHPESVHISDPLW